MRLRSVALAVLVASLPVAVAHADILSPGERGITHDVFLEGFERHPDLVFVVGPIGFREDVAYVHSGQVMPSSKRWPARVYAIARDKAPPEERLTLEWVVANAVAISWHQFTEVRTVDEDSPEHRIRTVFRLGAREGRKLVIEAVKEERFDADDKALLPSGMPKLNESDPTPRPNEDRRGSWAPGADGALVVLPAIALVGLFGTTWRRRRRQVG